MPSFLTPRSSRLSYRRVGAGPTAVCIPGGPLLAADYLGDLGGLTESAELILFDPPGSADQTESDLAAYRCDNVADDVETLRVHLELDRLTLMAHSAGANIALRYAERHPGRVHRLLLITPSPRAVGIEVSDAARSATAASRAEESWHDDAAAALSRIQAGDATDADWDAIAPFSYGRWDAAAAAFDARMNAARNPIAGGAFGAAGAFDPDATRTALSSLDVPVTIIAGELDLALPPESARELADLFPRATLVVQAGSGHFPWVDDPVGFVVAARRALGV